MYLTQETYELLRSYPTAVFSAIGRLNGVTFFQSQFEEERDVIRFVARYLYTEEGLNALRDFDYALVRTAKSTGCYGKNECDSVEVLVGDRPPVTANVVTLQFTFPVGTDQESSSEYADFVKSVYSVLDKMKA